MYMYGEASLKRVVSFSLSSFSVSLCLCVSVSLSLCVVVLVVVVVVVVEGREEKENWRDKSNHLVADSRESFPPDC